MLIYPHTLLPSSATLDYSIDHAAIKTYNERRGKNSNTRLQTHMPPAPFDGNPFAAKVVLLLNNPTYNPTTSKDTDHLLHFDGWPLAGLHPDAPSTFRHWYNRPLGYLIKRFGAQHVSQCVAIVQVNPWASASFDPSCALPSRQFQVEIARQSVERGAVIVIGRSIRFWREQLGAGDNIFVAKNCRNPTLSPGGLTEDAFAAVETAMAD